MTYDEMLEKTNLLNKLNILCEKFDTEKTLKKIIKKMSVSQLLECEIMLNNKLK